VDAFTIAITSLTLNNLSGLAVGFDQRADYRFDLLSFDTLVGSFSRDRFLLDLGAFVNSYSGIWSVDLVGNDFQLLYDGPGAGAAPLPGGLWLLSLGLVLLVWRRGWADGVRVTESGRG